MEQFLFDGWQGPLRTVLLGVLAYASLVLLLRISGKRTLSKMNAFDLVVTVALGSSLATVLLNKDVALAEGVLAFATLIVLQYIVASLSTYSDRLQGIVKSEPAMLLFRGEYLFKVMRRERVTEAEILAAIRSSGFAGMGDVETVVLETDGTFSVIARGPVTPPSSLSTVKHPVKVEQ